MSDTNHTDATPEATTAPAPTLERFLRFERRAGGPTSPWSIANTRRIAGEKIFGVLEIYEWLKAIMPRLAAEWGADDRVVLFVAAVMETAGRETPVTEPEASELFRAAEGAVLERLVARGQLTREMPRKVRRIRMSADNGCGGTYDLRDLATFTSIRGFRQGVQTVTLLAALGVVDPQVADLLIEDNGDGWEVLGLAGGLSTKLVGLLRGVAPSVGRLRATGVRSYLPLSPPGVRRGPFRPRREHGRRAVVPSTSPAIVTHGPRGSPRGPTCTAAIPRRLPPRHGETPDRLWTRRRSEAR